MRTIITVQQIDITSLINSRVVEVEQRDKKQHELRQARIEQLTPYIAQALFGVVEIHNKLVELNRPRKFFNMGHIEDAHEFVNKCINNTPNWGHVADIGSPYYTNVTFKFATINIWLSGNFGCMRYSTNPTYQIYGNYDVSDFLNDIIKKVI
jgi:hypothetical protein